MSRLMYTVDDLISGVRSMLDESNGDAVDDSTDILPSLNRALTYGMDVLARKYPEPLLSHSSLTLTGGTAEYSIPEDAFEDRILKVEIDVTSGRPVPVQRVSFRDISAHDSTSQVAIPYYYCILGSKIRFAATPSGTYNARIWYLQQAEKLVTPQGRIEVVTVASRTISVDAVGADLSTTSADLSSYCNIVDGQTGLVKVTLQIQNITGTVITFRSSPVRSTVLGRTVASAIPTTIELDDYICAVTGSCVPPTASPLGNFLIEYSVAELTGKLGGDRAASEVVLEKFEKQLGRTWVGRERQMRVQKRGSQWLQR